MNAWVIVEIGCIECGDENEEPVVGVYLDEAAAKAKMASIRAEYVALDDATEALGFPRRLRDDPNGFHGADSQVRLVEAEVAE